MNRAIWAIALAASVAGVARPLEGATRSLRGIAIEQQLDSGPLPVGPPSEGLAVRLSIDQAEFNEATAGAYDALQTRLEQYQARHMTIVIALNDWPATDSEIESWGAFLRSVVARGRGAVAAYQVGYLESIGLQDLNRYVYLLKLAAVQIRSVDPDALVLEGSIPATALDWQRQIFEAGAGSYLDGVAIREPEPGADASPADLLRLLQALIKSERPSAVVLLGPVRLPTDPKAAVVRVMDGALRALGTEVGAIVYTGDEAFDACPTTALRLADLLTGDLVALDDHTVDVQFRRGASDVPVTVEHRVLYSLTNFHTFLVYWAPPADSALDIEISVANVTDPRVRDPVAGTAVAPLGQARVGQGQRLHLTVPGSDDPLIVDFNFGSADVFVQKSEVQREVLPSVEEIIFRYQQSQAVQDAALENYVAHLRIEQHFHPSAADPPYNLVTENQLFADRRGVEWEELSFELNGAKWTANRPSFPLVQPEKVLSLPLDLRLNQDYSYHLDGLDTVEGRAAFVVQFDPIDAKSALYRGKVWIDRQTFVRLKVQAVETRLTGTVVSNEETQWFEAAGELQERPVWLLKRLSGEQVFLIAGRSVLVERELHFSDFALNVVEFDPQRAAARASNRVMYRDTDAGVRYLVKQGENRVVSDQLTTSARAAAIGVDVDPSFDYPLPIGGLDILDFNFLNRDMQLALLFGGVIALGNIQHANLWGGKFDASVDFFGLAVKENDDVFTTTGQLSGERVDHIPASTGLNLGYQMSPFQKVIGRYELMYDAYFRDPETASTFVIPPSTVTSGEGAGYEYRRAGYSLTSNVMAYQRASWRPWGNGSGFDAADQTYAKYDVGMSKDFIFATFHTIHFNGTYFGGERLDRFSMYEFGLFDATRMQGVPSAVRFGELVMFRGSYSFNVFNQFRLDLFFDQASGRDFEIDRIWRPVTGTGFRLNTKLPWSTILQLDLGKSVLPDIYSGAGSTVLQVMLLKPL